MNDTIRLATPDDTSDLLAIYAPVVRETVISFELTPPSKADFRQRIVDTLAQWPWLVCAIDDDVAGYAYAGAYRKRAAYQWSAESSVYVGAHHRKKGVATALYTALFALLKAQGYVNVYAGTALPNAASVALHKTFGFQPIGTYRAVGYKMGAWHDVAWWQLSLREQRDGTPDPPRSINAVAGSAAYERAIQEGIGALRG